MIDTENQNVLVLVPALDNNLKKIKTFDDLFRTCEGACVSYESYVEFVLDGGIRGQSHNLRIVRLTFDELTYLLNEYDSALSDSKFLADNLTVYRCWDAPFSVIGKDWLAFSSTIADLPWLELKQLVRINASLISQDEMKEGLKRRNRLKIKYSIGKTTEVKLKIVGETSSINN